MKKTITKIISITLVVAIMILSAPLSGFVGIEIPNWLDFTTKAFAANSGACGENLKWEFNKSTGTLTISGTGAMDNYTTEWIDTDEYCTYPWYNIKSSIVNVVIEEGVTTIGELAFYDCYNMTSISLPDSLTIIEDAAFNYCGLTSIIIPNNVTTIDEFAFDACVLLQNIILSDNLTTIGRYAFRYCTNLKSITIPDSVTTIGVHAFENCSSLENVVIGTSLTMIGESLFEDCSSLKKITVTENVKSIGKRAFYNCTSLNEVVILNGVKSIGNHAFFKSGVTSITIPDSVTQIGDYAFSECKKLSSLNIGNGLTGINDSAFSKCDSLSSVVIGSSVRFIDVRVFENCNSLTSINVDENNMNYSSDEFGVLFNKDKSILVQYPTGNTRESYIIPSSVTSIGDYAFNFCENLVDITLPNSLKEIGYFSFAYCYGLLNVSIPDSVTIIDQNAFYECINLQNITIGNSVEQIKYNAFYNCYSLESVVIPKNVTFVDITAFRCCNKLDFISVDSNNLNYCNDEFGVLFDKNKSILIQYPLGNSRTDYTIPDSVVEVAESAFAYSTAIKNVSFGASVKEIGDLAFYCCKNLSTVELSNCVETIGKFTFNKCGLLNIVIPDSVTSIGESAFAACDKLTSVTIGSGTTKIPYGCFNDCTNIRSIVFPDSLTSIGSYAFDDSKNIKEIFYLGTSSQWSSITGVSSNLLKAAIHYNCKVSNEVVVSGVSDDDSVSLNAIKVNPDDALNDVVNNFILSSDIIIPYDIHLHQDGNQVQPDGTVTVRIPVPDNVNPNNCKVFYIDENGNETDMNATYNNGYMEFQTDHFSVYVVAANYFRIELSPFKNQIRFDKDANGEYIGSFDYRTIIELKGLNEIFADVDDIVDGTDGDCIIESGYLFNIYNGIDFETAKSQIQGGSKVYAQVKNSYISTSTISGSYAMSCLILDVPDSEVYTELTTLAYVVYIKDGETKYAFYETTQTFEDLYNEYFDKAFPA